MIVCPSTISILATSASGTGMPSAVWTGSRPMAWGEVDDAAVELGHDVEAPLAFVQRADRLAAQGRVDQPVDVVDADVVAGAAGRGRAG